MSASAEGGDHAAYAEWRRAVELKLRGRSFDDALVSALPGGIRVEPLSVADGPPAPVLGLNALAPPAFGSVLGAGESAPEGPDAAWWCGAPAPELPRTLRVRVVEGDALAVPDAPEDVTTYFATGGGTPGPRRRFRAADGVTAHERGAAPATEVAAVLFAALEHARRAPVAELRASWCASAAVGPDVLVEVAKLRAMRAGLAGIARRFGASPPPLVVRSSFRSLSRIDKETNAVRGALAAAAALIGGADVVCGLPYDAAEEVRSGRGAHLAWTTPAVLALESGLGRDGDLADGSHAIEALTAGLGRAAWAIVRELDAEPSTAEERLRVRIASDASERARALATRALVLVGTSRFPPPGGAVPDGEARPLRPGLGARDAAGFEALALLGRGRAATLVALGDAALEPRVAFVVEAAEVAGLRVERRGPFADAREAIAATASPASVALVCTSDAALASDAVALVRALRAAGARAVLSAGKPRGAEAALRDAGVSGFLHVGCDLVTVLGAALREAT